MCIYVCMKERKEEEYMCSVCNSALVQGQRKTLSVLFLALFLGLPLNPELGWWPASHSGPSTSTHHWVMHCHVWLFMWVVGDSNSYL